MRLAAILRDEFGLEFSYLPYDPAFPEYGRPTPAELVCCIEVLEHVEPELIDSVLKELAGIVVHLGFFTIHCADSGKFLPDGRNAHILQRPVSWWVMKLSVHFNIQWLNKTGPDSFAVLVSPIANREVRLDELNLYQRDSIKRHIAACRTALWLEVRRRVRRGRWRPH